MDLPRVAIFGATGRLGALLVRACSADGYPVLAVGRRPAVLAELAGDYAVCDLDRPLTGPTFLCAGDIVINAAHARYTAAVVALCPQDIRQLIVVGSTRYRTRFPDLPATQVRDAVRLLQTNALPWTVLHPTMIYGRQGENNLRRMATLIRRFRVIPLPGGGANLIQPIHVADVVAAVLAAMNRPQAIGVSIDIAGPAPQTYRAFLRDIAGAVGCNVWVPSVPLAIAMALAAVSRVIPGVPRVSSAEIRRLTEDKDVDISPMIALLGVRPRPLQRGLAEALDESAAAPPTSETASPKQD